MSVKKQWAPIAKSEGEGKAGGSTKSLTIHITFKVCSRTSVFPPFVLYGFMQTHAVL